MCRGDKVDDQKIYKGDMCCGMEDQNQVAVDIMCFAVQAPSSSLMSSSKSGSSTAQRMKGPLYSI